MTTVLKSARRCGQRQTRCRKSTRGAHAWGAHLRPFDAAIAYGRTETAFASDFDQSNIGASYKFGSVKAMGLYHMAKFGVIKQRTMLIGAITTFGQSEIRASYIVNDRSGGAAGSGFANGDDSRLMALGYVLNLSKRTALHGTASRITNDGAARAVVGGFPNNPALTGMLGGRPRAASKWAFRTGFKARSGPGGHLSARALLQKRNATVSAKIRAYS